MKISGYILSMMHNIMMHIQENILMKYLLWKQNGLNIFCYKNTSLRYTRSVYHCDNFYFPGMSRQENCSVLYEVV